jgi:hypothetical protein
MIGYNKQVLLNEVIRKVSSSLDNIAKSIASAKEFAQTSPGRMQSRYDSSKEEYGKLADSLTVRQTDIRNGLSLLRNFAPSPNLTTVSLGCIARIALPRGAEVCDYYALPYGGGESIESDGKEVVVITPNSPIFIAMKGLPAGSEFAMKKGDPRHKILEII